jgi:hypothetical protein
LLALRTLLFAPRAAGGTLRPRRVATLRTDAARAAALLLPSSEGDTAAQQYVFVANAHGAAALFPLPNDDDDDGSAAGDRVLAPVQAVDTACASGAASFSVGAHTSFVGVANGCGAEATFFALQQPASGALHSRPGSLLRAAAGTAGVRVQAGASVAALHLPAEGPGSAPEDARTLVAVAEAGRGSVSVFEAAPAPAGLLLLVPLQTLATPYAPPRRARVAHATARVTTCTAHPPAGGERAAPLRLLLLASPAGPSAVFAWDSGEHAFWLLHSFPDVAARAVACFATSQGDTALLWAAADDAGDAGAAASPLFRLDWSTRAFVRVHGSDVATRGARDVAHLRVRGRDVLAVAEHGAGDAACAAGEGAAEGAWWWQRWRRRRLQRRAGRVRLLSLRRVGDSFATEQEGVLPARCAGALHAYAARGRAMLLVLSDAAAADAEGDAGAGGDAAHSALWALD